MVWVVLWFAVAVITALAASARGRSGAAWLALGLVFGVFALIAVLVMAPVTAGAGGAAGAAAPGRRAAVSGPRNGLQGLDTDDFDFDIVGEASYQEALRALADGEVRKRMWARLKAEPDNPHDANAVAVTIEERTVGYLSRRDAADFADLDRAERRELLGQRHPALIVGFLKDGRTAYAVRLAMAF